MSTPPAIALVEDDEILLDILRSALQDQGWVVSAYADGDAFVGALEAGLTPDAAVLDIVLPGATDGIALLERLRADVPACRVVMVTAHRRLDHVLGSLRGGAAEFLLKPVTAGEVVGAVGRALQRHRGKDRVSEPGAAYRVNAAGPLAEAMGQSPAVAAIEGFIGKAASSDVAVLLTGETGTGKELVATAIHAASPRADGPLVVVNCGAIPETLVESELFGYLRGSFTGADADRVGLLAEADGGTLFLDEVGELTPASQVKLLRALQEGKVRPVGGRRPQAVDIRVISATNRDLEEEVASGRFRQDLFYRLSVLRLRLPPLRERPEDIPHLVGRFLERYGRGRAGYPFELQHRAMRALQHYPWPGNVRELENEIARLVTLAEGEDLRFADLSPEVRAVQEVRGAGSLRAAMDLKERLLILKCLEATGWNKAEAARVLGMSRQNLYQRLAYHDIPQRPPGEDVKSA